MLSLRSRRVLIQKKIDRHENFNAEVSITQLESSPDEIVKEFWFHHEQ
jgi:hypothetical protein